MALSLVEVVERLGRHFAIAQPSTDPFRLILWENIGYLIDDRRRAELMAEFEASVGLDAAGILRAADEALAPIARRGGMRPETRIERWRQIARIVQERCGGDLRGTLDSLPFPKARALLKRFPTIGDPGADKVMLFSGLAAIPCLESNGLRAMARLGLTQEQASYAASYKAAVAVLARDGRPDRDWLVGAHLRLRELGRTLCRRGVPQCLPCPLEDRCPRVPVGAL